MKSKTKQLGGVTILELLVATAVLALLVLLIAQLFNSASSVTTHNNKRLDADAQARGVLDRMGVDFGRAVLLPDVDYFVKTPVDPMIGNDQIAFYAETQGYYPATGVEKQSPISLVGFRIKASDSMLERLGKGLLWNGVASGASIPMVYAPLKLKDTWPAATNQDAEASYEPFGPQVFRFEYGYVLQGVTLADGTVLPSIFSKVPWDTRSGVGHTELDGFRDVAAITVTIAVIDPKSRALVSASELNSLSGTMADFDPNSFPAPGDLEKQWQTAIDGSSLPKRATGGIFIYRRTFPMNSSFK